MPQPSLLLTPNIHANGTQVFRFEDMFDVRITDREGNPWFVAKDVCAYFGELNYRRAISRLDEDEKGVSQIATPGGNQSATVISESGLYALLFHMQPEKARGVTPEYIQERLEKVRRFRKWVTSVVLPTIRKHGAYLMPQKTEEVLSSPDALIKLAEQLKAEQEAHKIKSIKTFGDLCRLEKENASLQRIIKNLQDSQMLVQLQANRTLATARDLLEQAAHPMTVKVEPDWMLVSDVAARLGTNAALLNMWLVSVGILTQRHRPKKDILEFEGKYYKVFREYYGPHQRYASVVKWSEEGFEFIATLYRKKKK